MKRYQKLLGKITEGNEDFEPDALPARQAV